jgi:protein-S-isoprenylcysteine O-methyltransferase
VPRLISMGVELGVVACCAVGEYLLEWGRRVRERLRDPTTARDLHPASRSWLGLTQLPTVIVALATAPFLGGLALPGAPVAPFVAGLLLIAGGLCLRWWAILTLSRYFAGTIHIRADHRIVRTGPYRCLRHPAYAGGWLFFTGIGLGTANWLGLALCALLPLIGLVLRIGPEEAALRHAAPAEYTRYTHATPRRLIPFVW